jgi:hypothetical protein
VLLAERKVQTMTCKHCGNSRLFYSKIKGKQYYNGDGEVDGYDMDVQGYSVYCQDCNKRVCSTRDIERVMVNENQER